MKVQTALVHQPISLPLSASPASFLKMLRLVRFGKLRRCEALPKNLQITYINAIKISQLMKFLSAHAVKLVH